MAASPLNPELRPRIGEGIFAFLALFTSTGTLICCALPILLVTLGLGSAVIGLTGAFPWLVTLSRHKEWVFGVSAVLLALGGSILYRRGRGCPSDPRLAQWCNRVDRWNRRVYWIGLGLWAIGFFAAFLLLPITQALAKAG